MTETVEERFARLQAEGRNPVIVDGEIEVDPIDESPIVVTTRHDARGQVITRTANLRGGADSMTTRHGDVLAGGVPDADRRTIVVESVGNSGANANRVLHSDYADGGNTIPGGRPSSEIAIEQRSRINAGAYERKGTTRRRDISDEERLEALRRRVPESMVSEEGGQPIEAIRAKQAQQSQADRAAAIRAKIAGRR
jgi:hypothetical protein